MLSASSAAIYLGLAPLTVSHKWEDPFFTVGLAEKDIALALESARFLAVPMPVVAAAHQLYVRAVAAGRASQLFCSTLAVIEEAAGVAVGARPVRPTTTQESR